MHSDRDATTWIQKEFHSFLGIMNHQQILTAHVWHVQIIKKAHISEDQMDLKQILPGSLMTTQRTYSRKMHAYSFIMRKEPLYIEIDASEVGLGAEQLQVKDKRPVQETSH